MEDKGVIYTATGKIKYVIQAEISAKSIKRFNDEIKFAICTDLEIDKEGIWDDIIFLKRHIGDYHQYMMDKINTFPLTPYKNTLYLDSDTYILNDITHVFDLLKNFDLGVTSGHNRQRRHDIMTGKAPVPEDCELRNVLNEPIPLAFAPLQGGFLLYRKNEKIDKWLNDLKILYKKKNWYDDQVSLREMLWKTDLKFYVLPNEYNFNDLAQIKYWRKRNWIVAKPHIFHYTDRDVNVLKKLKKFKYRDINPFKKLKLKLR